MESLGSQLKAERSQRKIPLEKIADDTRINLSYLRCLEDGRYAELPGGMYNRAFLRAYCDYLGVDPKGFLQRYEIEVPPPSDKTPKSRAKVFESVSYPSPHPILIWSILLALTVGGLYVSRGWITAVFSPYFSRPPSAAIMTVPAPALPEPLPAAPPQPTSATFPPEQARPDSPLAPAGSGFPATTVPDAAQPGAAGIKSEAGAAPAPAGEPSSLGTQVPAVSTNQTPAAAGLETHQSPVPAKAITIQFHTTQKCWASVTSDGKRVFSRVLEPAEDPSFSADQHIAIVLGNAGGVRLTINGIPAKALGKPGEVVKVLIDGQSIPNLTEKATG
jgi:cytoskeleton protein RodZ